MPTKSSESIYHDNWIDHNKNGEMDPYENPDLPVEKRVENLLSMMTLREKVRQLSLLYGKVACFDENGRFSPELTRKRIMDPVVGFIGALNRNTSFSPRKAAEAANAIQKWAIENDHLGIPLILTEESLNGYQARGATVFPQAIGLASSWDRDLLREVGQTAAEEVRATGGHQVYSPVLGIAREPRWGRTEETYGEDPYLTSQLGLAMVRGLQGGGLSEGDSVMATAKHFAAHSRPRGGRNRAPIDISERRLRDIYLPPFKRVITEAGCGSIMPAYNEISGIPCHANEWLLRDLLRDEWNFDGFTVSDARGIEELYEKHRVATDMKDAVKQAINAGIDVRLSQVKDDRNYVQTIVDLVKEGKISEERLNEAVASVLRRKFQLGLFEDPYVDPDRAAKISGSEEHRRQALQVARKSMVLLKNDGNLLPLKKDVSSIAVIGPNANEGRNLFGDYSGIPPGGMESVVTPLEGVKNKVSSNTEVEYLEGTDLVGKEDNISEAEKVAEKADVAIVFVGEKSGMTPDNISGEARDRASLDLPGLQLDLVKAVQGTGTQTIVVLINGRPLSIPWIEENVPAILEAWYPGMEGGTAIADVLFGDFNPSGKLPITFPRSVGQLPLWYNHEPGSDISLWHKDYVFTSHKPLFEFGHGLSYTEFEYTDLQVGPKEVDSDEDVEVRVNLRNTGDREGTEVVQLYVNDVVSSLTTPVRELKGFERVSIEPGEQKTVNFTISMEQLSLIDRTGDRVVEPGIFEVMVGELKDTFRGTDSND